MHNTTFNRLIKVILGTLKYIRERIFILKKRTVGIIVGIIAIAALIFFVWPRETQNENVEVEITQVDEQDFQDIISLVGIIEPVETEFFMGQGPVAEVNVALNDEVAEDDVLASYLEGTQFIAPFSGTVVELNITEGDVDANAQQSQPSLVLSNLNNLEVVVELSKNEANRVTVDQEVEMTYLDTTYTGTVTQVDAVASTNAAGSSFQMGQSAPTLNATITFNDENVEELIPGFDIDVDIITETTTDSLAIPIESVLYNDDGNPFVFIVEDGVAHTREIETGIQEGVTIEVTSGLELDEEVIRLPEETMEDGTEVSVVNDENEDSNE